MHAHKNTVLRKHIVIISIVLVKVALMLNYEFHVDTYKTLYHATINNAGYYPAFNVLISTVLNLGELTTIIVMTAVPWLIILYMSFAIAKKIQSDPYITIIAVGLIPITFTRGYLTEAGYLLALISTLIYFFLKIQDGSKFSAYSFTLIYFILLLSSNIAFFFLLGFILYIIFNYSERKKSRKIEYEIMLSSSLLFIWSQIVLAAYLPTLPSILSSFQWNTELNSLLLAGIVPILVSLWLLNKQTQSSYAKLSYFMHSLMISAVSLATVSLLEIYTATYLIGFCASLLMGIGFNVICENLQRFKTDTLSKMFWNNTKRNYFVITLLILIISSMPAIAYSFMYSDIAPYTPDQTFTGTVLAPEDYAYKIGYSSQVNIVELDLGHKVIFNTGFDEEQQRVLAEQSIKHILTKRTFRTTNCFEESMFTSQLRRYDVTCTLN